MRTAIKVLILSVVVFATAFLVRRLFFWDVMPISWDQEPPRTGALETAFLLLSIQNTAAAVAAIAAASGVWLWWTTRWRRKISAAEANSGQVVQLGGLEPPTS